MFNSATFSQVINDYFISRYCKCGNDFDFVTDSMIRGIIRRKLRRWGYPVVKTSWS